MSAIFSSVYKLENKPSDSLQVFDFISWLHSEGYVKFKDDCEISFSKKDIDTQRFQHTSSEPVQGLDCFNDKVSNHAPESIVVTIEHGAGYGNEEIENKTNHLIKELRELSEKYSESKGHDSSLDVYYPLSFGAFYTESEDDLICAVRFGGDGYVPEWDDFPAYCYENSSHLKRIVNKAKEVFSTEVDQIMEYIG